jgi:Domain of unknown function (DUF4372)
MYAGKLVFAQVMEFAPWHTFRRLVAKYRADFNVRTFSCLDQFSSMAFAQITFRKSLRDIEACLEAHAAKAYHLGLRGKFTRSNLADANERCDWRLYCEFAQALIRIARKLYATEPLSLELDNTVYALGHVPDVLRNDQTKFTEQSADLIRLRGARLHKPLAHTMYGQDRLLLDALDRHKTHVRSAHRFADRFGIGRIVLIRFNGERVVEAAKHLSPAFGRSNDGG